MIAKLLVSFTTWAKNRIEANKDKQCFDNESVKKERSFDLSCWQVLIAQQSGKQKTKKLRNHSKVKRAEKANDKR